MCIISSVVLLVQSVQSTSIKQSVAVHALPACIEILVLLVAKPCNPEVMAVSVIQMPYSPHHRTC